MTKHLLAGVAAVALMSGVAFAQTYPPSPPPPPGATVMPVVPPVPIPGGSTSTTTTIVPGGDYRATKTMRSVDPSGNAVTREDSYQEGVTGSTETHTKTQTNPLSGVTTHSTTSTTTPR
jgi:hypothetical protein